MEKERLKELLKKALEHTLFDAESFGADAEPIKKSYCSTFLGMTEQEYNEIMGDNTFYWTTRANELAREFIKLQIENNDYYENIKKAYDKDASCINAIFNCWKDFDCYYSIYKIMDAIEKFMENNNVDSVEKVVEDETFDLVLAID